MVKKIMHDPLFLAQKSVDATEADKQVVTDLLDTLRANLDHCVGMAANWSMNHEYRNAETMNTYDLFALRLQ